ncbi:MAG TPA: HypC/HybG/HupF family hydrogenase formation chaperone [Acidimicrobiia bacterium]
MPARVLSVDGAGREAVVDVDGAERRVSLAVLTLDGRTVEPGVWLLVHTGLAVETLDPADAAELVALHRSLHAAQEDS